MDFQVSSEIASTLFANQPTTWAPGGDITTQLMSVKRDWTLESADSVSIYGVSELEFDFEYPEEIAQLDMPAFQSEEGSEGVVETPKAGEAPEIKTPEKGNDKKGFVPPGQLKPDGEAMTISEKMQVSNLKLRDRTIRAHEMAHLAAAGAYAQSGASYEYEMGPDGKKYAVHGHVMIDSARESTPEATIKKMRVVRKAALAPASPSPQDLKVAASALRRMVDAIQELRQDKLEEAKQELEKINKQHRRMEKEIEDDQNQEVHESRAPSSGDDTMVIKFKTQPEPMLRFSVNSFKKYTVNVAQYQYDSLALYV